MRWEDGDNNSCGIPSRVVQYEGTLIHQLSSESFLLSCYVLVIESTIPWCQCVSLNYMSICPISVYWETLFIFSIITYNGSCTVCHSA